MSERCEKLTVGARSNKVVEVLSADAALEPLLMGPPQFATAHSVFRRTLNLAHPMSGLVTLEDSSVDDAPASLRVATSFWANIGAGAPVVVGRGGVDFGHAVVRIVDSTRWWQPTRSALSSRGRRRLVNALTSIDVARQVLRPSASAIPGPLHDALSRGKVKILDALLVRNESRLRSLADSFIGLGNGLTPSGDDFLTGLMLVASIPDCELQWAWSALAVSPGDRTTDVSVAMLNHAAAGRFRADLVGLSEAICAGDDVEPTARRVAAIGSSSGTDMLDGVTTGLQALHGYLHPRLIR